MRRFELVDGTSSKFWQIERDGAKLTIQWGKIGTAGQSQTKDFPNEAKATAEHDKLVVEKTKKGYAEVGAPSAGAPAAKPRAAKAKAEKASEEALAAAPAPSVAPAPVVAAVELPARSAGIEIDWSAVDISDNDFAPYRNGHLRLTEEERNADPWSAVRAGWLKFPVSFEEIKVEAELVPAANEAQEWLEGKKPAPLSPLGAAVVSELLWVLTNTKGFPVMRAMAEPSIAKYGVGWIIDVVLGATQVQASRTCSLEYVNEGVGPFSCGRRMPEWFGYLMQTLSDEAYAEFLAEAEARWPKLSYFQKALVLEIIPEHTKLADALGEEWLAADGMVEGYKASPYQDPRVQPELGFAYSPPILLQLAKKYTARGYHLADFLWRLLDLIGADVLPLLEIHLDAADHPYSVREGLEVAAVIRCPQTAAIMVSQLTAKKEASSFAVEWLEKNPVLALPTLADALAAGNALSDRAAGLFVKLDGQYPGFIDKVELRPAARTAVQKLREKMATKPDASPGELPRVLANPPWTSGKKAAALPVVGNVAVKAYPDKIHEELDGLLAEQRRDHAEESKKPMKYADAIDGIDSRYAVKSASRHLSSLKKQDVKKAFAEWPPEAWSRGYNTLVPLAVMGEEAIAGYPRIAMSNAALFAAALRDAVESPKLAGFYAHAWPVKSARKWAEHWANKFPKAAAVGLVPIAVGNHGRMRDQATAVLRFLVSKGHGEIVREVAESYGAEVNKALKTSLEADPRDQIPSKLPKMPVWANADKLPRPVLRGREKALPKSAVEAIFTMLSISTPEEPYVGLEDVVAACDRASLEDFSWALFNEWQMAGAPSKENWGMQQLGFFGGDEVARKLTPMIRSWPGENLQARAVAGLDILARIGTDLALMHLNGVAQKVKFKALQEKAREKMDEVAQNRGLTADELADRLVPDLDLDEDGSRTLDFGSRQFRVSFDEALKPVVVDGNGKTLTDLPKPNKSDDATKAKEAETIWKTLKKDAKAIAQNQITRLELAMCAQRRWEQDSFRAMFLEHPLMIHLVRRLVWGVYDEGGKRMGAFRVAEDSSFADAQDSAFTLPDGARVGIVHPLELTDVERAALGQLWGDYAILQPFPQIARDTYAPTEAEKKGSVINRRTGQFVPAGKIMGLVERGWRKGAPQDAGWIWEMFKPLPGGLTATLCLESGISADMQYTDPKQKLGDLSVDGNGEEKFTLGELSPVLFSELVRDIVQLGSVS